MKLDFLKKQVKNVAVPQIILSFAYWANWWYTIKKLTVGRSQAKNLYYQLKLILRYIGDYEINGIKPMQIDFMFASLVRENPNTHKPTSRKYLLDIRNTTIHIFDFARENDGLHISNPAKRAIPRNAPKKQRRAITEDELYLIMATSHRARLAALIMIFAGLRRGELIPLKWTDFDYKNYKLRISKSVEAQNTNKLMVKEGTKTNREGRVISVPKELIVEVELARKTSKSEFVCSKLDGSMHTLSSWRSMWKSFQTDLNVTSWKLAGVEYNKFRPQGMKKRIDNITPHMLRHTYATILYVSGVDILNAAKLLGHEDPRTTLVVYTHLTKEFEQVSIAKLQTYVSNLYRRFNVKDDTVPLCDEYKIVLKDLKDKKET